MVMKFAVVAFSGTQYKVSEGDTIEADRLDAEKGQKIEIKEVLLIVDDKTIKVGKPFVAGAKVSAEVLEDYKGEKIRVSKFKAKSRYRRTIGFRHQHTALKILKITYGKD